MRRARLFALLVPAVAVAAACSSGGTFFPGTGGAGGSTGHSSGTGNASTGTGGTGTSSSGNPTTSSSGNTTTSSSGNTTTSSSTGSSSSGTASGACTDAADAAKIAAIGAAQLQTEVTNCATQSGGAEPGTKTCIKTMTMLSDGCVTCFDNNVQCAVMKCLVQCIGGMSAGCTACLHTNCTPAFNTCSGLMGP